MTQFYFSIFRTYSNQPSDHLPVFLRKQFKLLTLQTERLAYVAWQTQVLPQNHPKEFIQLCSFSGCCYCLYCCHSLCISNMHILTCEKLRLPL